MLGADGFKATFVFFLSSFFSLFFLHHPTLFRWKRALRFASPGAALAPRFRYPVPELVEGSNLHRALVILANTGIHAWFSFRVFPCPSVANASAFAFSHIILCLMLLLPPFSVSLPLSYSVFFRVIPWQMLLLPPFSVANASSSAFFRVNPWLILMLRQPSLTLPALNSVSFRI